ncbi:MAG: 50S ribosomal protein L15 [Planctomycetota bacterium]|mgnify:FL=1|nr:MAG: 50S ribosomal protein L15 [Planctomycetota bacterium]REJ97163.1 MAG: 50S ribosomal protein L15 [Planctomycetota bacterium]
MNLNDVHRGIKKFKSRRRIGRGPGSGHGKTSGRGHKGQGSRSGYSRQVVFQGGTMPMIRRVPKRGFNNKWALAVVHVNVEDLESNFDAGVEITPELLVSKSLIPANFDVVKILGNGELKKKFTVTAHRFSGTAREKIEQAGGQLQVLPGKKPVVKNPQRKSPASSGT